MIYVDVRYAAVLQFRLLFGLFHAGFSSGFPEEQLLDNERFSSGFRGGVKGGLYRPLYTNGEEYRITGDSLKLQVLYHRANWNNNNNKSVIFFFFRPSSTLAIHQGQPRYDNTKNTAEKMKAKGNLSHLKFF